MKVELHVNGSHQVILIPETPVEKAVLWQMQDAAQKGRAVKIEAELEGSGIHSATVSVEA